MSLQLYVTLLAQMADVACHQGTVAVLVGGEEAYVK